MKYLVLMFVFFTPFAFANNESAIFAGGCFWCLQADFDKLPGVISTTAGYDGGTSKNPTYQEVSSGSTNYAESVQVIYDSDKVSYSQVLNYFWHHVDPTVKDKQFCDEGKQYRTVIFYLNQTQKKQAETSLQSIKQKFPEIYTQILPSTEFYPAEEYHQKYYLKNPTRYKFYRWKCGRDQRIKEIWHDQ